MKLVVGMGKIEDYEALVEAGADEIFCGFVPNEWNEKYGTWMPLNRREVLGVNVQVSSYEDMKILKKMENYYGVPITVTFNSLYYLPEQYPFVLQIIENLIQIGYQQYIVADLGLLLKIQNSQLNCKIHISGEFAEYNLESFRLFQCFLPSRYIFHRKMNPAQMKKCIKEVDASLSVTNNINMEYEAFYINELCHFSGAYCNSLHCDELLHLCQVPYELGKVWEGDKIEEKYLEEDEIEEVEEYIPASSGCGVCKLPELKNAGITHLKIVGRGNYIEQMILDVKMAKKSLELLEETGEKQWEKRARKELFLHGCGGSCYY